MAKTKLNLTKFRQNPHPFRVKMMAKLFRRGISVQNSSLVESK